MCIAKQFAGLMLSDAPLQIIGVACVIAAVGTAKDIDPETHNLALTAFAT